jgi:pilus assembly protein CpaF
MVHLGKSSDGRRRVLEICEVAGMAGGEIELNTLFKYEAGKGLRATGAAMRNDMKLRMNGRRGRSPQTCETAV